MCESHFSSLQCIIPPYIAEHLIKSEDQKLRELGVKILTSAAVFRTTRRISRRMATMLTTHSSSDEKQRIIFDSKGTSRLQHQIVRSEGDPDTHDDAVDEAYAFSGDVYDFFKENFNRISLDDEGMALISNVHVADPDTQEKMDNAFWDGTQMAFGDGTDTIFERFTKAIDVVGHEFTHGVISYTCNLFYRGQSGALNEHFADVFGVLIKQWKQKESVQNASWLVGSDIIKPAQTRRALRDMENPGTAFRNDQHLGDDPQPSHMKNIYTGNKDYNGVHINSGIPNRAFVLVAKAIGGNAWDTAGHIWYNSMNALSKNSNFTDCAKQTVIQAQSYGEAEKRIVKKAWENVGILV